MKTHRKYIYRLFGLLFGILVFISACGDQNSNPVQSESNTQKALALVVDHPTHYVSNEVTCGEQYPCSTSIQAAINDASAGDSVQVLAGTYNESVVLKSGVAVQGAGVQNTTIDATGKGSAVIAMNLNPMELGNETKIDGFTIKGGSNYKGGGFYIFKSSITMSNLVITGNRAEYGGGIYNYDFSSPIIANTIIYGNIATTGGGIYNGYMSSPIIYNATIIGNTASGSFAGGIRSNSDAILTIQNSIITSNFGVGLAGSIISDYNVVWGNTLGDYNPGLKPGTHDISDDPKFVDAANGDYRLHTGSPCVDIGSNAEVPAGLITDINGKSRIMDGNWDGTVVVDMGAVEYELVPVIIPMLSTLEGKAGRAMAIKFEMRVDSAIDPLQPFIHNEDLEIKISDTANPDVILQTIHYGFETTDYRFNDPGQFYIINFKTAKIPATYTLEILRGGSSIGKFTFITVK